MSTTRACQVLGYLLMRRQHGSFDDNDQPTDDV